MVDRKSLEKKFTDAVQEQKIPDGFIKVTDNPVDGLNNGNIEDARRIYITTGYSDGLTRVGDYYMNKNESLKALKAYYLAHNKRDAEPIYENLAKVISTLIQE